MSKTKDLSATYKRIPTAEQELEIPLGTIQMGQRIGGVSMYSNSFKRGYGDSVFIAGNDGISLGNANFEDAPFRVTVAGEMTMQSNDGKAIKISAPDNNIIVNDGTDDIILIGYQLGGF